jgi:RNA polymerase sigma-70 factor, ECF subfamily
VAERAELVDGQIIEGLARGDTRAFDLAYERLRAPLYTFLVRLTGRPALAEDLLQETWLRLARHAGRLPADTELRAWLFTVARNLYRSHRRWVLLDTDRLRQFGLLPSDSVPSPFEAVVASTTERNVERALISLRLEDRELLLLCSVAGFQPTEAAGILGITPVAVRQRLVRARAKLRERLETGELLEAREEP